MPELPEVETVRRSLQAILGEEIVAVRVLTPAMVRGTSPQAFEGALQGRTIGEIARRGKYLLFHLDDRTVLVCHLMMAGRLWLTSRDEPHPPHTHVVLGLGSLREIRYQDLRHFGGFRLVRPGQALPRGLLAMGPEPFDPGLTPEQFRAMLGARGGTIKGTLLDQSFVAGLGNIYVDEALFEAGIHPETPALALRPSEAEGLLSAIRLVLDRAIRHRGTTFGTYVDVNGMPGENGPSLRVFRREGKSCDRCGTAIVKLRVAGRGTHICPSCQRPSQRRRPRRTASSSNTRRSGRPGRTSTASGPRTRSPGRSS